MSPELEELRKTLGQVHLGVAVRAVVPVVLECLERDHVDLVPMLSERLQAELLKFHGQSDDEKQ